MKRQTRAASFIRGINSDERKSSNGRRAVSKTVNVGSIPAFRAVTNSFQSDFCFPQEPDCWRE